MKYYYCPDCLSWEYADTYITCARCGTEMVTEDFLDAAQEIYNHEMEY